MLSSFIIFINLLFNIINGAQIQMRINYKKSACMGVAPMMCLRVQEGEQIGGSQWYYFYSSINGFNYQEGFIYDILVETTPIENPPADGSSIRYDLIQIQSQIAVPMPKSYTNWEAALKNLEEKKALLQSI